MRADFSGDNAYLGVAGVKPTAASEKISNSSALRPACLAYAVALADFVEMLL